MNEPQRMTSPKRNIPLQEKKKDDVAMAMIQALNQMIQNAREEGLGTAAFILKSAKEELVYWVAYLDYEETPQEKFIHEQLLNS